MKRTIFLLTALFMPSVLICEMNYFGGYIYLDEPGAVSSYSNLPSIGSALLDAQDEKVGQLFKAGPSIVVSSIAVSIVLVTTGGALDLRLETVDGATGLNSGSLYCAQSSATLTLSTADSGTWKGKPIADCTIAPGDYAAVVVVRQAAGNVNIGRWTDSGAGFTYTTSSTTAAGLIKTVNSNGMFALYGPDGVAFKSPSIFPYFGPQGAVTTYTFNKFSAINSIGVYFKSPFGFNLVGSSPWIDSDGFFNILVRDSSNVVIASCTANFNNTADTNPNKEYYLFNAPVVIRPNLFYRMSYEPITANNISLYSMQVETGTVNNSVLFKDNYQITLASNPTTLNAYSQIPVQRLITGFIIDGIETNPGGSLGIGY